MKPPSKGEEEEMIVKKISSDSLTLNEHTFTFDSIADPESTQVTILVLMFEVNLLYNSLLCSFCRMKSFSLLEPLL